MRSPWQPLVIASLFVIVAVGLLFFGPIVAQDPWPRTTRPAPSSPS